MSNKIKLLMVVMFCLLIFSGCGGGGGSDDSSEYDIRGSWGVAYQYPKLIRPVTMYMIIPDDVKGNGTWSFSYGGPSSISLTVNGDQISWGYFSGTGDSWQFKGTIIDSSFMGNGTFVAKFDNGDSINGTWTATKE